MKEKAIDIVKRIVDCGTASKEDYAYLIKHRDEQTSLFLKNAADHVRRSVYGNSVFIRGLIEISNICRNDCYYCGIRRSNRNCERYRLTPDEIINRCDYGYVLGFRTFVLQGGEDAYFTDKVLCELISAIKTNHPDCAITLSLGERSYESYKTLYNAGADRYLLRHETADAVHYGKLHPSEMSFDRRLKALNDLKIIGFQTGCGFMVGSPYQTAETLAEDLKFVETFQPEMCGIGPFIPHKDTPFADKSAGTAELTCFLLSVIRLICPKVLLPATTALATVGEDSRIEGIRCGANVIMPNLTPATERGKYALYDGKRNSGTEAAEGLKLLKNQLYEAGYEIVIDRGDVIKPNIKEKENVQVRSKITNCR